MAAIDTTFLQHPWQAISAAFTRACPTYEPYLIEVHSTRTGFTARSWRVNDTVPSEYRSPLTGPQVVKALTGREVQVGLGDLDEVTRELSKASSENLVIRCQSQCLVRGRLIDLSVTSSQPNPSAAALPSELGTVSMQFVDDAQTLGVWDQGTASKSVREPLLLTPTELLRRAAFSVMAKSSPLPFWQSSEFSVLFHNLDTLSRLGYERRPAEGQILVYLKRLSGTAPLEVELHEPVPIGELGPARRLIEMSRPELPAVSLDGGRHIHGFGQPDLERPATRFLKITYEGRGAWILHEGLNDDAIYRGAELVRGPYEGLLFAVRDGVPHLPSPPLDQGRFCGWLRRTFRAVELDADALWTVAEAATRAAHGALIVFSPLASDEAERIQQATRVRVPGLSPEVLDGLLSVDGALLVDLSGHVHAMGAILDGGADRAEQTEGLVENSARGSRYNSAVRYSRARAGQQIPVGLLVASEDGRVDLLPA